MISCYNGKIQDVVRAYKRTFNTMEVGTLGSGNFLKVMVFMPKGTQKPSHGEPCTWPFGRSSHNFSHIAPFLSHLHWHFKTYLSSTKAKVPAAKVIFLKFLTNNISGSPSLCDPPAPQHWRPRNHLVPLTTSLLFPDRYVLCPAAWPHAWEHSTLESWHSTLDWINRLSETGHILGDLVFLHSNSW